MPRNMVMKSMNSNCGKVRKTLIESDNLKIFTPELAQAKAHLRECSECGGFLKQHSALRAFLKEALVGEKTPAALREDILRSISQKQAASSQKRPWRKSRTTYWFAAAALAMILAIFAYFEFLDSFKTPTPGKTISAELIDDHIRYRLSAQPVEFMVSEPQALTKWLSTQLDFSARIPQLPGFELIGGRLCYLFNRRVALAFYQDANQQISFFVMRGDDIDLSYMKQIGLNGKVVCRDENKGYYMVAWKQNDLLYALVSDHDVLELVKKLN